MPMLAGGAHGSMPCLIAFSTSEITIAAGSGALRSSTGTSTHQVSRSPMRIVITSR